jgi:4-hydroxythreonine-4-phosphate dehydrogenase
MKPLIAITMGDYNGIGPEIVLKCVRSPEIRRRCHPVLVGSLDVFAYYARRLGIRIDLHETDARNIRVRSGSVPVINTHPFENPAIHPGAHSPHAGKWAGDAVRASALLCVQKRVHAMVTAPVSKAAMIEGGYRFPGQTEMVASLAGRSGATMMLIAGTFRTALATVHVPLRSVPRTLNRKLVEDRLTALNKSLRTDFRIRKPRIAVLGLNPHAGEFGKLGREEINIITPAISRARNKGIDADGPFPADGFFGTHGYRRYDAVLAMYHDQGLIPLKMSGFETGVNFSAGLPIVRTSPDHGTAFAIAGKGAANPSSMIQAIQLAAAIIHNRNRGHR